MPDARFMFKIPKSIGDEQEFGLGKLPWFFTRQEWGLIALTVIGTHLFSMMVIPSPIVQMLVTTVILLTFVSVLSSMRKGKPASYLWDFQYRMGAKLGKGWYRYDKKRRPTPIQWFPGCRPSSFVPSNKLGDRTGFLIDNHFRLSMPAMGRVEDPVLQPRPLFPPRVARRIAWGDGRSSDCPLWWRDFHGDARYADVETIDLAVDHVLVPMNEKGLGQEHDGV
ncbi:MAG: hypothetical protein ACOCXA_05095 [Planctomycetota bacterium]